MLSLKDLLENPEQVQPLGSRKGVLNKPSPDIIIDINEVFLSSDNTNLLTHSLYNVYSQNGGKVNFEEFSKVVKILQKKFASQVKLDSYCTVDWQATMIINYVEILKTINNDFTKHVYCYFHWNEYNPFHDKIEVGPSTDRRLIKSEEIMPDDFGTIDLWREQSTQIMNRKFRDNNKIPAHRIGIHARHYDRSNEGFANGDSDRSSLETPIYGYNTVRTKKAPDAYSSSSWYSM